MTTSLPFPRDRPSRWTGSGNGKAEVGWPQEVHHFPHGMGLSCGIHSEVAGASLPACLPSISNQPTDSFVPAGDSP